ncbi:hypothetical protein FNF31_00094 [Cafeteria roenbergensis]|uniref:IPT/TIG domain-containing protein n=1 Tax=Cafeteria roenbergensis TaxID=33653 RepID=A0A5A8DU33_CAFRO|nr:hypothetical protein FNF31_00094 [Cafeteria roenbergensis]
MAAEVVQQASLVSNARGGLGNVLPPGSQFGTAAGLGAEGWAYAGGGSTDRMLVGAPLMAQGTVFVAEMGPASSLTTVDTVDKSNGDLRGGKLSDGELFGSSVALMGAGLRGAELVDMVVGAPAASASGTETGGVFVLSFDPALGLAKDAVRMVPGAAGVPSGLVGPSALLGASVAAAGDLDGDGVPGDLLVGAPGANSSAGMVVAMLLDIRPASTQVLGTASWGISSFPGPAAEVWGPPATDTGAGTTPVPLVAAAPVSLQPGDAFGAAVAMLGNASVASGSSWHRLAAVGAPGRAAKGAVFLLTLACAMPGVGTPGEIPSLVRVVELRPTAEHVAAASASWASRFGASLSSLGNLDHDPSGTIDLAIGDDGAGSGAGFVLLLSVNSSGWPKRVVGSAHAENTPKVKSVLGSDSLIARFGAALSPAGVGPGAAAEVAVGAPDAGRDGALEVGAIVLLELSGFLAEARILGQPPVPGAAPQLELLVGAAGSELLVVDVTAIGGARINASLAAASDLSVALTQDSPGGTEQNCTPAAWWGTAGDAAGGGGRDEADGWRAGVSGGGREAATWASIVCALPPLAGAGWSVRVRSANAFRTAFTSEPAGTELELVAEERLSVRPPRVLAWHAPPLHSRWTNASATGGPPVTIRVSGSDFGGADFGPVASVGGVACAATRWVNDSAVECDAPSLGGAGHAVSVSVGMSIALLGEGGFGGEELVATVAQTLSFSPPRVLAWHAPPLHSRWTNASATGGPPVTIRISGSDFGGADFGPVASVGGVACAATRWVNDSAVECDAPSLGGAGHAVSVSVGNQSTTGAVARAHWERQNSSSSASVRFSFAPPELHSAGLVDSPGSVLLPVLQTPSVDGSADTKGGSVLRVRGRGFGVVNATLAPPGPWDAVLEAAAAACGPDVASDAAARQPGNATALAGWLASVQLASGSACTPVEWRSDSELWCQVPAGAGRNMSLSVSVCGQLVDSWSSAFDGAPPGTEAAASAASQPESRWAGQLSSRFPVAVAYTRPRVDAVEVTQSDGVPTFTVTVPPQGAPGPLVLLDPAGGDALLVRGEFFGVPGVAGVGPAGLAIDGVDCANADWTSDGVIRCPSTPAGEAQLFRLDVVVNGARGSEGATGRLPLLASYVPYNQRYVATFLSEPDGPNRPGGSEPGDRCCWAAQGGAPIRLEVRALGSYRVDVSLPLRVRIGSQLCLSPAFEPDGLPGSERDAANVTCTLPPGTGSLLPVVVEELSFAGGPVAIAAPGAETLSFSPPRVLAWHAPPLHSRWTNASATGGPPVTIRISGSDFGGADFGPVASVGGVACAATRWVNDSAVECDAPSLGGAGAAVTVSVGNQSSGGAGGALFAFAPPEVHAAEFLGSSSSVQALAATGGEELLVRGRNFGAGNLSDASEWQTGCAPRSAGAISWADAASLPQQDGNRSKAAAEALAVAVGGLPCRSVHWRSDRTLVCITPAGAGANLTVTVQVCGLNASSDASAREGTQSSSAPAPLLVSYRPPAVERVLLFPRDGSAPLSALVSAEPPAPGALPALLMDPSGGERIQLLGHSFGPSAREQSAGDWPPPAWWTGSSPTSFALDGNFPCESGTVVRHNDSAVECTSSALPVGLVTDAWLLPAAGGQDGAKAYLRVLAARASDQFAADILGPRSGVDPPDAVHAAGSESFGWPPAGGATIALSVRSVGAYAFDPSAGTLAVQVWPAEGTEGLAGGGPLACSSAAWDAAAGSPGQTRARNATCVLPAMVGAGHRLVLEVRNATGHVVTRAVTQQRLSFAPPVVESWSAPPRLERWARTSDRGGPSVEVRLAGRGFGGADFGPRVLIGGVECAETVWSTDALVTCRVPSMGGHNHSVVLLVGNQSSDPESVPSYSVAPPEIHAAELVGATPGPGVAQLDTVGGLDVLRIRGRNFGAWEWDAASCGPASNASAAGVFEAGLLVPRAFAAAGAAGAGDGSALPDGVWKCLSVAWESDSQVLCVAPSGAGAWLNLTVSLCGVTVRSDESAFNGDAAGGSGFGLRWPAQVSFRAPEVAALVIPGPDDGAPRRPLAPSLVEPDSGAPPSGYLSPAGDELLLVTGRYFGDDSGSGEVPLPLVGGSRSPCNASTVVRLNDSHLLCRSPAPLGLALNLTAADEPSSSDTTGASAVFTSELTIALAGASQAEPSFFRLGLLEPLRQYDVVLLNSPDGGITSGTQSTGWRASGGEVVELRAAALGSGWLDLEAGASWAVELQGQTGACGVVAPDPPGGRWARDADFSCVMPPGVGRARQPRLLGPGVLRELRQRVSFVPPRALAWHAPPLHSRWTNASATGGPPVTIRISGSDFGGADFGPVASVGGVACAATRWVNDSAVECDAPSLGGAGHAVSVSVGSQSSGGAGGALFAFAPPEVHAAEVVSPGLRGLLPTTGGATLLIRGRNFGAGNSSQVPSQGCGPEATASALSAQVGGRECESTSWLSDTVALCVSPVGVGANVSLGVSLCGALTTSSTTFVDGSREPATPAPAVSFELPQISAIELVPSSGGPSIRVLVPSAASPLLLDPAGSEELRVFGAGFGPEGVSPPLDQPRVSIGPYVCDPGRTVRVNDSLVVCSQTPPAGGVNRSVNVAVAGQTAGTSSGGVTVRYLPPLVDLAYPQAGHAQSGGSVVSIIGRGFGLGQAVEVSASIGGRSCTSVSRESDRRVLCALPPGVGSGLPVEVVVSGQRSLFGFYGPVSVSYEPPVVLRAVPATLVATAAPSNASVLLLGRGFGVNASDVTQAWVAGSPCLEQLRWLNSSAVQCDKFDLAAMTEEAPAWSLALRGQRTDSSPLAPSLPALRVAASPTVDTIDPPLLSASGGSWVTLNGRFGWSADQLSTVLVGELECSALQWVSAQQVRCKAPAGAGKAQPVVAVSSGGLRSSANSLATFTAPRITSVDPPSALLSSTSSLRLTLLGEGFGTKASDLESAAFGGQPCPSFRWLNSSAVECSGITGAAWDGSGPVLVVANQTSVFAASGSGAGGSSGSGSCSAFQQVRDATPSLPPQGVEAAQRPVLAPADQGEEAAQAVVFLRVQWEVTLPHPETEPLVALPAAFEVAVASPGSRSR